MSNVSTSNIVLNNVSKTYDNSNTVIPTLTAEIPAGLFTVILGPSGCGKSTLLRMIAGLESTSAGTISIAGVEVQNKEPKDRGCAMVFQNYALYPHMTVFKNIGYSLKIMGLSKPVIEEKVKRVAASMGLMEYLERQPHQLSGGQRQRVAIGRAIVREPKVLLFDEPLSNLDAQLRNDMRIELSELHRRINATSVFVTHDQVEAMTLADRILILNKGKIEQFATPKEIYHNPASIFVAQFIGSPAMNIFDVEIVQENIHVNGLSLGKIPVHKEKFNKARMGIRPEDIVISPQGKVTFDVSYREDLGSHLILHGKIADNVSLKIITQFGTKITSSDKIMIDLPIEKCHFFGWDSSLNLNLQKINY